MLKKTIKYTDFNGEEVTEEHFFHLSKAELVEMEVEHEDGGLSEALKRMAESDDRKAMVKEFKHIILASYGKRTPDGRRFVKNREIREEFESSEAYSTLFMELATEPNALDDFMKGVIPPDLSEQVSAQLSLVEPEQTQMAQTPMSGVRPESERVMEPKWPNPDNGGTKPQTITRRDLVEMSASEYEEVQKKLMTGEIEFAPE